MTTESQPTCAFCTGTRLRPTFATSDAADNTVQIWQCLDCYCHIPETAFDQAAPVPEARQISFHEDLWCEAPAEELDQLVSDLRFMVKHMAPLIGPATPGRKVVELGCGRGGLLRALLDCKYDAVGCEPGQRMVDAARRHYHLDPSRLCCQTAGNYLDTLEQLGVRPGAFILWHVLEHVKDPLPMLERCHRMLGPDGRLIFQLPMLSKDYIFPEHYFFFTLESIEFLSQRLGGLPFGHALDTGNRFLSIFMGEAFRKPFETRIKRASSPAAPGIALAEPIETREQIIQELQQRVKELEARPEEQREPEPRPGVLKRLRNALAGPTTRAS